MDGSDGPAPSGPSTAWTARLRPLTPPRTLPAPAAAAGVTLPAMSRRQEASRAAAAELQQLDHLVATRRACAARGRGGFRLLVGVGGRGAALLAREEFARVHLP